MKEENIGTLCPLCKRGVIQRIRVKTTSPFQSKDIDYTTCTNEKCGAYVEVEDDLNL